MTNYNGVFDAISKNCIDIYSEFPLIHLDDSTNGFFPEKS